MAEEIPLDQIEAAAIEVLSHYARMGRPLTKAEQRDFGPIEDAYEAATETRDFRKLAPEVQAHHQHLLAQLHSIVTPPIVDDVALEEIPLQELVERTRAALDLRRAFRRPLLPSERQIFRPLAAAWQTEKIGEALKDTPRELWLRYNDLFTALMRQIVDPDPPEGDGELVPQLDHQRPEMRAELHDGNYSLKNQRFSGKSIHRLTTAEAKERMSFIARLCNGIAALTYELALVHQREQDDAAEMVRLGTYMVAKVENILSNLKGKAIPATPSPEEVIENARKMGALLRPEGTSDAP